MLRADVDTPGNSITAKKLTKLDGSRRDAYRGRLYCPDEKCKAPAYFVSPKRNAKHGHFASRHHTDECEMRSTDLVDIDEGQLREERALIADSDIVKIRFDQPMIWKHGRQTKDPKKNKKVVGATRTRGGKGTKTSAKVSMGLKRLLAHLVRGGGLGSPSPKMQLSDGSRGYADKIIKDTVVLGDKVPDGLLIFYGKVVSTNLKDKVLWLNSGNYLSKRASVRMDESVLSGLLTREDLSRRSQLVGMWFICEAQAIERFSGGANLRVDDIARIAFLKA
ncbi:hypothetical protein [Microbacterium lacticum]